MIDQVVGPSARNSLYQHVLAMVQQQHPHLADVYGACRKQVKPTRAIIEFTTVQPDLA
jgi:hypothetical protein